VQIIGAGLPRTGTSALEAALDRLGFGPCYHSRRMLERPGHLAAWTRACRGEPVDLPALLTGFRATTDAPACFFWPELVRAFPAARVVLGVRDPAAWCRSMTATVLRPDVFAGDDPTLAGLRTLTGEMFGRAFAGARTDTGWSEAGLTAAYHRHVDAVRAAVPAGRLLVHDVADGWAPLCAFLGVPVPDEEFPHRNSAGEFHERLNRYRTETGGGATE
jgi:hypothetical protein